MRCIWCHNPESWDSSPASAFLKEKCINCGECNKGRECFAGARVLAAREFTPLGLWKLIEGELPYYKNSGGGITFSGGECMLQVDFLEAICKICRQNGVHTAVDTAGHVPYEWLIRVSPDLFLYDIKADNKKTHKELTGVDGVLIWENLRRLVADGHNVQVRVPCVPGANWNELPGIARRLRELGVTNTELMPYHKLGESKAASRGYKLHMFDVPRQQDMSDAMKLFN